MYICRQQGRNRIWTARIRAGLAGVLVVALLLAASAGVLAAEKRVLKVGSDLTYAPFEFLNDKNEYSGFDVDIIRAVGKALGWEVQIINVGWDGLFAGLVNGNYDCVISAVTITPERAKTMSFSTPYYTAETGQVIVIRKDERAIKKPQDLAGKVVAVQINTTGQYAAEGIQGIKQIKTFNTTPEALQDVMNGGSQAAVIDSPVAEEFMKQHPGANLMMAGPPFTHEQYGIVVRKNDKALLAQINKGLELIRKNGEYQQIFQKWFGQGKK